MNKFKWCFIGTGKLAHIVAQEILASGRHEIVSCYTRNSDRNLTFAREFNCKAFDSAQEAILADGVDGVYIVTPHNAHYRYARLALESGLPVLCEKAFTVEAHETDELISIAKNQNLYLCEAMWTWFGSPANQVRKWIEDEAIGQIKSANFTYCMNSINYAQRVADPKRAGGALLDITIYPITYAYRLFGYPTSIESSAHIENGIDYWDQITMTFPSDIQVTIRASIVDCDGLEQMDIAGSHGHIQASLYHYGTSVSCHRDGQLPEEYSIPGDSIGYLPEFDIVASEIKEGLKESRKVPLKATSDVMHILDTIRSQIGLSYDNLE